MATVVFYSLKLQNKIDALTFKLEQHKEGIILEARELPGFVISAKNSEELVDTIQDALFVYFDIPRYYAKKLELSQGL